MAQIIKHRRGTAAQLKTVTLAKGEIGVSTGSVAGITTPVVHIGDGANASGFVVGRLFQGSTVPTLTAGDIGSSLNDMLFHDSATYKLYKLNTGGNENLDLTGNIANRAVTGSLTLTGAVNIEGAATSTAISASGQITASSIYASGDIHAAGNITFDGGSSGTITLGSGADDNVVLAGDVNSNIIPNTDNTFDLGSSSQQWKDLYINGVGHMDQLGTDAVPVTAYINAGEIDGAVIGGESAAAGTFTAIVGTSLDMNGNVDIDNATTTIDSSGAVSIDAGAASNLTTSAGALTIDGAGGINLGTAADTAFDIDTSTLDIDASGAITIDGSSTIAINGSSVAIESTLFSGANIGVSGDTDLLTLGSAQVTVAGETETLTLDVNGVSTFAGNITLDKTSAQTITHTGGSGDLTISSTNGNVVVEGSTFAGNNLTVPGNFTVNGTTTTVNSTTLEVGDHIVVLNTAGATADGGLQVLDKVGTAHTGSMLWNATNDYWYSGISGSTHYRIPQQTSNAALTQNSVIIPDANGRLTHPVTGGTVDFADADLTSVDMIQGVDANTHIDIGTSDTIEVKGNVLPNTTNADDIGSDSKRFKDFYLEGNADIDGTLNVEGVVTTQATIAATAGITVTNTAATINSDLVLGYDTNAVDRIMIHDGGTNSVDFSPAPGSTSTNGDTAGEYLQWNGSAFVMTQTIDGGSF